MRELLGVRQSQFAMSMDLLDYGIKHLVVYHDIMRNMIIKYERGH
jgi:hypothetical protein